MNLHAVAHARLLVAAVLVFLVMMVFTTPGASYAIEADDDIPGVPISPSPLSGTVDARDDSNDVYSVDALVGQVLTLSLIGSTDADLDLYLFGSTTTSLGYYADALATSKRDSYPETISYLIPASGSYRIAVRAFTGSSAYALSWNVEYPQAATLSAITAVSNRTPAYNVAVTITGMLQSGGAPLVGEPLALQRLSEAAWVTVAQQVVGPTGQVAFSVVPFGYSRTVYRVFYAGQSRYESSGSTALIVRPKAYVRTPDGPSSITAGRAFTVWGFLRPRHLAGTYPVRVYKQRWNGSRWVSYGYVYGRAVNYYSYSKYLARVTLPRYGNWRLRAYHADVAHYPVYSGWLRYR